VARYLFHISDGRRIYRDDIGVDLPDQSTALDEARATAYQLMVELAEEVEDWSTWQVRITDGLQLVVILPFPYALSIPAPSRTSLPLKSSA